MMLERSVHTKTASKVTLKIHDVWGRGSAVSIDGLDGLERVEET